MMIPDGGGGTADDPEQQNSARENFVCGVVEGKTKFSFGTFGTVTLL